MKETQVELDIQLQDEGPGTKTQPVRLNLLQLRAALRIDAELFIQFFLGEHLTQQVPDFHCDIFVEMTHTGVLRLVIAIPRAHAKTTLAKLCCVWYLLFSDYRFVLYVSASHDLVIPYVNDIASFFESPNFIEVFGEIKKLKWQDGVGIYKFYIPSLNKTCILRGLGAGQRVRGINVDNERPQLAVVDDVESDEDTETDAAHQKMIRWWFGPFKKCLNQFHNKIIVMGNLTSKRSLLWKFLQSKFWRSYLYGCLRENGEPLWPDLWPIKALKNDYLEYLENGQAAQWFAEMMNIPVAEGGGVIKAEEICYKPPRTPEEIEYGFITIDPAISSQSWADNAAIGAHGWVKDEEQWQTLEEFHQRGIDPTTLFFRACEMANKWGFKVIGVEADAMQAVLEHHFQHLRLLHQQLHLRFVKLYTGNRKKTARIASWASMLKQTETQKATWALTFGDFIITQQLLSYEPMRKDNADDIIDMCAYAPQMIDLYLMEIMRSLPTYVPGNVQTMYDIAEV